MTRRIAPPRLRFALQGALLALLTLFLFDTSGAAPTSATRLGKKRAKKATAVRGPARVSARPPAPGVAGLKAYIDPVTGKLTRPTVDDTRPLESLSGSRVMADDTPIPVVQLANGTEMSRLDDRYQEFAVVRVGPDGRLVRDCVRGNDAVAKFQKDAAAPARPTPAREVK